MRTYFTRLARLILGLFVCSFGIAATLNARIGYFPWDVFHEGLANTTGITIGVATIFAGIAVIVLVLLLKEKIGLGSLLNIMLVGSFLDFILWLKIVPKANSLPLAIIMLLSGLFLVSLGTYFYIGSAFGAGPRDSLMVALAKKTKLPIGVCRGGVELTALLAGWRLGGMVGIGTVISALLIGPCIQLTFRLFGFDATQVQHQALKETFGAFYSCFAHRGSRRP